MFVYGLCLFVCDVSFLVACLSMCLSLLFGGGGRWWRIAYFPIYFEVVRFCCVFLGGSVLFRFTCFVKLFLFSFLVSI